MRDKIDYNNYDYRQKVQERKKLQQKRRRRIRIIHLSLRLTLLTVLCVMSYNLFKPELYNIGEYLSKLINNSSELSSSESAVTNYTASTPHVYEDEALSTRLLELTKEYPDYRDIYDNMSAYPEELLSSLCNNPEMLDYVKGYLTADGTVTGGLTADELESNCPLLLQWDSRWGYYPYGDNTVAMSGCAPTCLSMVIVGLTHNSAATPDKICDYAMECGYYAEDVGTTWSLMTEGCEEYGLYSSELCLDENSVLTALENDTPIICSVRPGDFTTAGHFIVLTGVKDGKIIVNDPNCILRSQQLWDYDTLSPQIKNLWAFYTY